MNINMVYVAKAARYGIECDAYRVVKRFPKTYKELQEYLHDYVHSYYTPFPMPALEEGYDWGDPDDYTGIMVLSTYIKGDHGMQLLEHIVLQGSNVYIMNNNGKTVDTIKI